MKIKISINAYEYVLRFKCFTGARLAYAYDSIKLFIEANNSAMICN